MRNDFGSGAMHLFEQTVDKVREMFQKDMEHWVGFFVIKLYIFLESYKIWRNFNVLDICFEIIL